MPQVIVGEPPGKFTDSISDFEKHAPDSAGMLLLKSLLHVSFNFCMPTQHAWYAYEQVLLHRV